MTRFRRADHEVVLNAGMPADCFTQIELPFPILEFRPEMRYVDKTQRLAKCLGGQGRKSGLNTSVADA